MAHPTRGNIAGRRGYRSIPRRVKVRLLNRQSVELCILEDAFWASVSFSDSQIVANLQNESRTWKLPQIQLTTAPQTGYRIREVESEVLWEIMDVDRPSDDVYHCVCVRMNEHNGQVP